MSDDMIYCSNCGEYHDDADIYYDIDGNIIGCIDCMAFCQKCSDLVSVDEISECEGDYLCAGCIESYTTECRDCNDRYYTRNLYRIDSNNTRVCWNCFQHYDECSDCGYTYHLDDDMYYNEHTGHVLCSDCYQMQKIFKVHDYDYKPRSIFHFSGNEAYQRIGYGIENETDKNVSYRDEEYITDLISICNDEDLFYLKKDGSLSSAGVEIVTHPGSLTFWKNTSILSDICEIAKNHGYKSHDSHTSCGLHIHASKEIFGTTESSQDLVFAKLILIIEKHWHDMLKISRRTKESMEHWCEKYSVNPDYLMDASGNVDYDEIDSLKRDSNHYKVINITDNTFELRLFRGTLKIESIYAALEFYDSLIKYCQNTPLIEILNASFDDIRSEIIKDTKCLEDYLNKRLGA